MTKLNDLSLDLPFSAKYDLHREFHVKYKTDVKLQVVYTIASPIFGMKYIGKTQYIREQIFFTIMDTFSDDDY